MRYIKKKSYENLTFSLKKKHIYLRKTRQEPATEEKEGNAKERVSNPSSEQTRSATHRP